MEFIEGETLSQALAREGRFQFERAVHRPSRSQAFKHHP
jgi:hypothetical protein